ncbi:hypothetical protein F5I97DRAFT_1830934 [Phlebopus sp. FC_14]|nr:hypothetical protein F5I97DRAFT_1830934 [Phlebopus sp. FC_14]
MATAATASQLKEAGGAYDKYREAIALDGKNAPSCMPIDLRWTLDAGDWIKMYNDQVKFEAPRYSAWTTATLEAITQQALRASRNYWKDVSKDDRGVILSIVSSEVLGVTSPLRQAYSRDPGSSSKFPLETLLKEAAGLLTFAGCRSPCLRLILNRTIGFYHAQMARYSAHPSGVLYHQMKAGEAYLEVGRTYLKMMRTTPANDALFVPTKDTKDLGALCTCEARRDNDMGRVLEMIDDDEMKLVEEVSVAPYGEEDGCGRARLL